MDNHDADSGIGDDAVCDDHISIEKNEQHFWNNITYSKNTVITHFQENTQRI